MTDAAETPAAPPETEPQPETRPETQTHAEWWASDTPPHPAPSTYTDAQAAASLRRAGKLVVGLTGIAAPVAWFFSGWRGAAALLVGALISGTGLWEWRRLMAALTARMDAAELVQSHAGSITTKPSSIAFAIVGFSTRLLVVVAVLYASLTYLHGSVPALAAGLAMGVVALTVEAIRLLRSGTI